MPRTRAGTWCLHKHSRTKLIVKCQSEISRHCLTGLSRSQQAVAPITFRDVIFPPVALIEVKAATRRLVGHTRRLPVCFSATLLQKTTCLNTDPLRFLTFHEPVLRCIAVMGLRKPAHHTSARSETSPPKDRLSAALSSNSTRNFSCTEAWSAGVLWSTKPWPHLPNA